MIQTWDIYDRETRRLKIMGLREIMIMATSVYSVQYVDVRIFLSA